MAETKPTAAQRRVLEAMVCQRIQEHHRPSPYGGDFVHRYVYVQRDSQWVAMTVRTDTFTAMKRAGWLRLDPDKRAAYLFYSLSNAGKAVLDSAALGAGGCVPGGATVRG